MNGKEFLEDFDPQIKEVRYDNYSYTPKQVIQRLDAFKKQLLLHNVVGRSEQLPIARCGCEEPDPTEIKVCVQCDGYVE